MNYTGSRAEDAYVEFLGEYGYMGTINNAAFYVQKKCWKDACEAGGGTWILNAVTIYKEWEDPKNKMQKMPSPDGCINSIKILFARL